MSIPRADPHHLRILTGLRGWAALWVFLYHAWVYADRPSLAFGIPGFTADPTPLFSMGFAGVTIFFVLSGFLLSLPFARWQAGQRERPRLDRYFLHRALRVFPAYYAQLALLIALTWWSSGQFPIDQPLALIQHLLMLFIPPPLGTAPLNGVWWTLPIEFSFYLILPLLALLLRPERALWLLAGSLLLMYLWRHGVAVSLAEAPIPQRVVAAYQLPGSLDAFGLGMLAALLHVNRSRIPGWLLPTDTGRLGILGLLLILAAIYWLPDRRAEYWSDNLIFYAWTPALSLGIAAILLAGAGGTQSAPLLNRLLGNSAMVSLGLISYSLYLWHLPVLSWLHRFDWTAKLIGGNLTWILVSSLPPILAISTLSYLLVERPFMRLGASPGESQLFRGRSRTL